jgi:hypothetical protein
VEFHLIVSLAGLCMSRKWQLTRSKRCRTLSKLRLQILMHQPISATCTFHSRRLACRSEIPIWSTFPIGRVARFGSDFSESHLKFQISNQTRPVILMFFPTKNVEPLPREPLNTPWKRRHSFQSRQQETDRDRTSIVVYSFF